MAVDILSADKAKKYVRAAIWMLRKKLGKEATTEAIHDDLTHSGNPAIYLFAQMLNYSSEQIKERWQASVVKDLGEFFLWVMYKDTAYRDVFFWVLDQVLQRATELRQWIKPYVKDPHDWNVNVWHRSKKRTKKMRKENRLPPYMKSFDENLFVPSEQQKKLKRM
jgi:hypothetical protein